MPAIQPDHHPPQTPRTPHTPHTIGTKAQSSAHVLEAYWEEGRKIFQKALPEKERTKVSDRTNLADTIFELRQFSDHVAQEYGGGGKLGPKLHTIMDRLEAMQQYGDKCMEFAPETVSVVWCAFRMIFRTVREDMKHCQFLVGAVDEVSDVMFFCDVYAQRYGEVGRDDDEEVEVDPQIHQKLAAKLPHVYATVLLFGYRAPRFFEHNKASRMVRDIVTGSSKELADLLERLKALKGEVEAIANIAFQDAAQHVLGGLKGLHRLPQLIEVAMQDNKVTQGLVVDGVSQTRKMSTYLDFDQQVRWFRTGGIADEGLPGRLLEDHLRMRQDETGRWITTHPEVVKFTRYAEGDGDGDNQSSLLWLQGEAGFGKSILTATMVEKLHKVAQHRKDGTQVLYFFCQSGDKTTSQGIQIMLHLLRQLVIGLDEAPRLGHGDCADKAHEARTDRRQQLSRIINEARDVLRPYGGECSTNSSIATVLLPMFHRLVQLVSSRVYVVIDAIDECVDWVDGLLAGIKSMLQCEGTVRVFVASRPHGDMAKSLMGFPTISVDQSSNKEDIKAYILFRLGTYKSWTKDNRRSAADTIAKTSQGMFRYIDVIFKRLEHLDGKKATYREMLKELPIGMNELYRTALEGLNPSDRKTLLIALRWLICGQGEIRCELIQEEIDRAFEDEEEQGGDIIEETDRADFSSAPSDYGWSDNDFADGIDDRPVENDSPPKEDDPGSMSESRIAEDFASKLATIGRNFFRIQEGRIELQHSSIRDFIKHDESHHFHPESRCHVCQKVKLVISSHLAGPMFGHLQMSEVLLRHLNSPTFQSQYMRREDGPCNVTENRADRTRPDSLREYQDQIPRYELRYWTYHVRMAEEYWHTWVRPVEVQEQFNTIYRLAQHFLKTKSIARQYWQDLSHHPLPFGRQDHPIHIAAAYGLVGLVEHYLDQGTDPNIPNQQGNSPLHLCCLLDGGKRAMEVLIERSASINLKNQNGTTPLLMLFGSSPPQMEKIEYLLKNKADPDVADKEGRTCLQFAVQTSNQDLCERILRQGADINAAGEHKEDGRTCLHQAVLLKQGASEMVELLLSHQADVDQPDKLGRTPLHDAPAAPDSVSIIGALLGAGANFDAQDKDSRAPLYTAIQLANIEAATLLIDAGADVNDTENVFGQTALHAAIRTCNLSLVRFLVDAKATLRTQDKLGRDPVFQAVDENANDILNYLLRTLGTEGDLEEVLYTPSLSQNTLLHRAATNGNAIAAKTLIEHGNGPRMCAKRNQQGATPLHLAAAHGAADLVKFLLEHDPSPEALTEDRQSTLDLAFEGWQMTTNADQKASFVPTLCTIIQQVPNLKPGPDLLDYAVIQDAVELIELLLDQHPDQPDDEHGWDVLALAIQEKRERTLRLLSPRSTTHFLMAYHAKFKPTARGYPPTRWNVNDKHGEIRVGDSGVEISTSPSENPSLVTSPVICRLVRADHPVPAGLRSYYYEIKILESSDQFPLIGIGYCSRYASLETAIYLDKRLTPPVHAPIWIFHANCPVQTHQQLQRQKQPPPRSFPTESFQVEVGHIIGCGVNFDQNTIFYTLNSRPVSSVTLCGGSLGRLFPVVGMGSNTDATVRVHFGGGTGLRGDR